MSTSPVLDCMSAMQATLQGITTLNGQAITVYSENDLMKKLKALALPAAGIVYGGMKNMRTTTAAYRGAVSHQMGLNVELSITLLIVFQDETIGYTDMETPAIQVLDAVRNAIKDTVSPTGRTWEFAGELPALEKDGMVFWAQKWTTPLMLASP